MSHPVSVKKLRKGQSARIARIAGHPDHVHRLEEFGIIGGMTVEMFRPGNPCILRIGGSKVCFRSDPRVDILVQPTAGLGG